MARMHSGKKGKSGSSKPLTEKKHTWVSYDAKELKQIIIKLAKEQKTKIDKSPRITKSKSKVRDKE